MNWNDTLQNILAAKINDSLKVAELGKKIIYFATNSKTDSKVFLQSMEAIASKSKNPHILAELYYSKAVVWNYTVPIETIFGYIDSCLLYAQKAKNLQFQIRSYRMKGQYLEMRGQLDESKILLEKAIALCNIINIPFESYRTYLALSNLYEKLFDFNNSIYYALQAAEIADKNKITSTLSSVYLRLAKGYQRIGDTENALIYYRKTEDFSLIHQQTILAELYSNLGNFYQINKNYERAFVAYFKCDSIMNTQKNFTEAVSVYSNLATLFTVKGELDTAQVYFEKSIQFAEAKKYRFLGRIYLNYSTFLIKKKEHELALNYAEKAIAEIKNTNDKEALSEGFQAKAEALVHLKQLDQAISEYQLSLTVKDSINEIIKNESLGELLSKYETKKKENEIAKLNSDKQIQKLQLEKQKAEILGNLHLAKQKQQEIDLLNQNQQIQELKLNQQKELLALKELETEAKDRKIIIAEQEKLLIEKEIIQQKYSTKIMLSGFIILLLFIILGFNNYRINTHRKNDKEKYQLQNQLIQMKLEALRSQMNPHFIFNALNSINRYIIRNSKETASEYLIKFSKLIRSILENSKLKVIPLEKEIEAIQLYVDLELLRFDNKFDFQVRIDESINTETSQIPPLILQPFVENAIWHGLMKKQGRGQITIDIKAKNADVLYVAIEDNGVGRESANEQNTGLHEKGKSFGMQITADRINALNKKDNNIKIVDLYDSEMKATGTRVEFELSTLAA
ncbi:MAG: histidine kinase [Bacteroidetes bacterium]|nr:histidine kinase [Bacteroidota bacterium]